MDKVIESFINQCDDMIITEESLIYHKPIFNITAMDDELRDTAINYLIKKNIDTYNDKKYLKEMKERSMSVAPEYTYKDYEKSGKLITLTYQNTKLICIDYCYKKKDKIVRRTLNLSPLQRLFNKNNKQ